MVNITLSKASSDWKIQPNLADYNEVRKNFSWEPVRAKVEDLPDDNLSIGMKLALINSNGNPSPQEIPSPFQEPSIQPISPEISPMPPAPMEPKPIEISPFQEPGEKPIPEEMPPKVPIEPLPIEVPPKEEPGEKPIPDDLPPKKEPTPEKEPPIEAPPVEEPPTKEPVDALT